jgi:hypothetical protein
MAMQIMISTWYAFTECGKIPGLEENCEMQDAREESSPGRIVIRNIARPGGDLTWLAVIL